MARIKTIGNINISFIINECKKQDKNAQKILFERYSQLIFTTCKRYDSHNYPAKDLLQDTFIKAFDKIQQFDENKGRLENWLSRIAINLALNAVRKNKIHFTNIEINSVPQSQNIVTLYELSEEEILQTINELPFGYKTVFNLYVFDDFSHQEIAKELNISVSTSKSQLYKAKQMLQTKIAHIQKNKYGGF